MMRMGLACMTWVLLAAAGGGVEATQQPDAGLVLTLTRTAPVVRTGDAVLVSVEASSPLTILEGQAFGRPVTFWPAQDDRLWFGLVGIDMELAAGTYDLDVHAASANGAAQGRMSLSVEERVLETRRIRVADRFVSPSKDDTARILREAERLAIILAQSQPARSWRGPFVFPVPGKPTSSFGRRTVTNNVPGGRHRGVDFQAMVGTPVRAPNAGVVVLAEDLYFTGKTVIVDHGGGIVSLFAHFSSLAVDEGMILSGGELLGYSGATGRVTGPHLHWAMRLANANIDPLSLMSALRDVN